MGIGVSIFLLAVGAILAFAVSMEPVAGISIDTIGIILMVVGALGIVLSMVFWSSWGGFNRGGRVGTTDTREERTVVRDREII